ncbi:peroxisomal targeting signal receptor [[Candida] anglica]|uniref:Peroxisomal targeting signal receptor n=1 Tax=[Candida] anglica TaxID=148631 RepID=A0ABP0ENB4_9ASCO
MSFAAADCSGASNPLLQFNKHTQQDRSLQHQGVPNGAIQQGNNFKNESMMNARDRQNMDQFMNNSNSGNFQFQPMRHELNAIQNSSPQQHQPQQHQNWSGEFSPVTHTPVMGKSASPNNSQWASEFGQTSQTPHMQQQPQQPQQFNQRMTSYRPMMGGMSMMGSTLQNHSVQQQQNHVVQQQHQEPQVDWDNHFKEIEELTSKTQEADPVERTASPEIVIDDKYQATFQEVWDNLNSDAIENDFISQQYEDYKSTQGSTFPADMAQWERDFAKYASTRAHFGDYNFEEKEHNQFLDLPQDQDAYEIGLQLMENGAKLSEAALAFEAAIQKDQGHINAWLKLGEVQTQNEKEIAGISALEKCLELSPENSEALMTLAISYINEGYDNAAFATLERWISTKYPQLSDKAREQNPSIDDEDRFSLNKRVTELFLKAAQLSPNQANMDPDVQMGLGVLFYANEDFDKTIDCFKAALTIKPDDPVLWNRLGASLANSSRSEEAVDAYFKALELKPTFVRARYNLGVSCINIGCYKEAAEHLLSGLSMHQVEGVDDNMNSTLNNNQSSSLMETLKRAFIAMDRRDLLGEVKPGMDLNQFRGEFNF